MTMRAVVVRPRLLGAVLAAGLAGAAGCSSSAPPEAAPTTAPSAAAESGRVTLGQPFRSPADGYQISPPAGWVQRPTAPEDGISALFLAPTPDTSGQKPFNTNLNVLITPARGNLEQSVADTIQLFPSILQNYQLVINEPTVVSGEHPAHFLGGTYDLPGVGRIQNLQLVLVEAGKLYTITVTCPEKAYPGLQTNAVGSLSSFMLGTGS